MSRQSLSESIKQLRRRLSRWFARDPLKQAIDPYHDWQRLLAWWAVSAVAVFAVGGLGHWWLGGLEARVRTEQATTTPEILNRQLVEQVADELEIRQATFQRYQTETPSLVDPSR